MAEEGGLEGNDGEVERVGCWRRTFCVVEVESLGVH